MSPSPSGDRRYSVQADPIYGCLRWSGPKDRDGYGIDGRTRVHIRAWVEARGPIPKGLEVEHGCRRRDCCRVEHLSLVTRSRNEQLKSWKRRVKITHCPQGHDYATSGRLTPEGGRVCRVCCGL